MIFNEFKFEDHLAENINKASRLVEMMHKKFVTLDEKMFRSIYTAMVRPHLDC